jgi:hypothetical protein
VGSTARYRVEAAYNSLDGDGLPAGTDVYSGEMSRRIVDADPPAREEVVWTGFTHRTLDSDGAVSAEVRLEWADGFTYEHCFSYDARSNGIAALFDASTGIRRDLDGWNVFLLMLDAHVEFDMPRCPAWRIGDLSAPGDEAELNIGGAMVLDFRPFIRVEFAAGSSSRSRFVGVIDADGHGSAVLESDSPRRHPFTMQPEGAARLSASTSLRREIQIRLADGLLERGKSVEWVCIEGRWVNPVYTTELLGEGPE